MKTAVAYIRSSTNEVKQANSQAVQASIIADFAASYGYNIERTFSEYFTGKDDERVEFNRCLEYAKQNDCFIIVYRVDRVARSLSIFSRIETMLHRFRFCNLGDVQPSLLLMSVLLAVATNESIVIGKRVSHAMQMLKLEGRVFGNPRILETAQPLGALAQKEKASEYRHHIQGIIFDLKNAGYNSTKKICCRLNEIGVKTRTGSDWTLPNLYRVMANS